MPARPEGAASVPPRRHLGAAGGTSAPRCARPARPPPPSAPALAAALGLGQALVATANIDEHAARAGRSESREARPSSAAQEPQHLLRMQAPDLQAGADRGGGLLGLPLAQDPTLSELQAP
eukprot:CAMPEP_0175773654 /NCGR_PEP_ID=MMETSP0097-20121207/73195_1 /TAXON_ID=311494 /ORGANISM="Alexandrium monilatum, Strain CCMP3105" /LENGTH=120 /DNA_ID=CAMNT_0017084083 /DNA_START=39 /DNA_END=398 /DNA_ORIENTATION=-